jgi:hypothetical protein
MSVVSSFTIAKVTSKEIPSLIYLAIKTSYIGQI